MLCAKTKDEIAALMRQISFENDLINFAVLHQDGLSHQCGVKVNPKGDAYIYNRDIKHGEKVSLHTTGRQHVTMPPKTSNQVRADDGPNPT